MLLLGKEIISGARDRERREHKNSTGEWKKTDDESFILSVWYKHPDLPHT